MRVVRLQAASDLLSKHFVQGADTFVLENLEQRLNLRVDDHVHDGFGHKLGLVRGEIVDHHLPLDGDMLGYR